MNSSSVKQSVIDSYGKLAQATQGGILTKLFACCDPTKTANEVGAKIGYSAEELNSVPDGANLGVGCGNPAALSKISEGQTIIDLGSGAGFDAFIVSAITGESGKVIGIDLSEDMLNLAKKNAKKGKYNNVEFVKGDIESLPLEDDLADHVISNCVINLSLNKGDVYNEAYRVLKPGGQLSVSDIILEKDLPDFIKDSLAGHIACVSGAEKLEDYMGYIHNAGFKNIKIETKTDFPLELMLTDPQLMKIAKDLNFNINSEEAKDIASRVKSISISATK